MTRRIVRQLAAGMVVSAAFFCIGCGANSGGGGSNCGTDFKTVKIGNQTWMAENLNCNLQGSVCYDNDPANCAKYGRLYNWETAKNACPSGWHLPSDEEWTTLEDAVGGSSTAGTKLKSKTGWYDELGVPGGNGTDNYGFSALPGSFGSPTSGFHGAGVGGVWWSATEYDANGAWRRAMTFNNEGVVRVKIGKPFLLSVRCVKD